jgi:glycosyltransferase involved in cell wall biosynthesis
VLLPYDTPHQFASGVLSEAIAAQRPIVATDFPHARELLATGTGLLVPPRDPRAIAHAIRRILTEPGLAQMLSARCADLAPALDWHTIAHSYRALAETALGAAPRHRTGG